MISGQAYSTDLREKVMLVVSEGHLKLSEISKIFKINVKTIYKWRMQFKETGSIEPRRRNKNTYQRKIQDNEKFEEFVKGHNNSTLKEMAVEWGNISTTTIRNTLQRINFTFKKKHSTIKNAMKKKEKNLKQK